MIKPPEQVEQVADLKSAREKESIDVWDHMPIPRNAVTTHGVFLPPDLALNLSETLPHQRGALQSFPASTARCDVDPRVG